MYTLALTLILHGTPMKVTGLPKFDDFRSCTAHATQLVDKLPGAEVQRMACTRKKDA